jgi:putative selenium metabolism hydrolase
MEPTQREELWNLVMADREDLVAFAQELVRTPSMPGQEGDIARLIEAEMQRLAYDKVWIDQAGNVVGRIAGSSGPSTMLNGHMDHVDAGDPADWLHPPFGGEIHDAALWGRGAADMKGSLAAMVHAGGVIKRLGTPLAGDLYVSGVVQEEVGGLGARYLAHTLPVMRAVIGEASGNNLRRGHRGRVELGVCFRGRSVHASMPTLGINPHFSMASFIDGLGSLNMPSEPVYGTSTVAPTRISSQPESANVTPSELRLRLDWRNVPGEPTEEVLAKLETLLARSLKPECEGQVEVVTKDLTSYTGLQMSYADCFPSFTTQADHPWLLEAQSVLSAALGRDVEVGAWRFATDGGHFAAAGATVLGFGPGDETVVHTVRECLPLEQLVESVVGYVALCLYC